MLYVYIYDYLCANKTIGIMTRLETLKNRLERLTSNKEDYIKAVKIQGILRPNPKSMRYTLACVAIRKEIREIEKSAI